MQQQKKSFLTYPLSMDLLFQMLLPSGSHGLIRKGGAGFRQVMQALYDQDFAEIAQSVDCLIHAEEHYWLSQSRRVYYPVAELIQNHTDISLTAPSDSLFNGIDDSFILAVPHGMRFGCEHVLSGFLVTIVHNKARDTLLHWPFFDWIGQPRLSCAFDNEDDISFCVNYVPASTQNVGVAEFDTVHQQEQSELLNRARLVLNSKVVNAYLKEPSLKTFLEILTESDIESGIEYTQLNSEERAQQYDIFLYILNFLLYRKACPNEIKPGVPGGDFAAMETEITKELQHLIVG